MKTKLWFAISLILQPILTHGASTSETIDSRRGLFRLLSADINEPDAYNFKTSVQYSYHKDLLKDIDESTVQSTEAGLAFGYALLPQLQLAAHGGFRTIERRPQEANSSANPANESVALATMGAAVTGTYDLANMFSLQTQRLTTGLSVWINFSRITRFFKGVDVIPTAIFSGDFTDSQLFPFRVHANAGFRYKSSKRYFENTSDVTDLERLGTKSFKSSVIQGGLGFEFPFEYMNPSLEAHIYKAMDTSFMNSPKWITLGLKGRPFPQKNIEVFGAADIGLSTFKATASGTEPKVHAVPLWNAVFGFGIGQFGRREGEVGVNQKEYDAVKKDLSESKTIIGGLERDLEFNTVRGRVIDAETKRPMSGVSITAPETPEIKSSTTADDGRFVRYFKALPGNRLVFSKEGYESSSKFLSLRPGERVTVDIELKKSTGENLADFVATITDQNGQGVAARLTLRRIDTGEISVVNSDAQGQLTMKVAEGRYLVEIRAEGFRGIGDQVEFTRGKTILRTFSLVRGN